MNSIVEAMNWRYACKKYSDKKVSQEDIDSLLEILRLTASSLGLQAWKFVLVESKDVRAELLPATYNQAQAIEASHFIVLCRKTDVSSVEVDQYVEQTAKVRGITVESLEGFKNMVQGYVDQAQGDKQISWLSNQVYIALGTLLTATAAMKIDSTPIEGLNPAEYDRILDLPSKKLATVVACAIGYRHEEDKYAATPKVRFDSEDVILKL